MRLNKKGFTLIELLAVVVIMLAISVMAVSSISAAIERNKKKQDDAKIKVIESYAELYYQEHKNSLQKNGCILVSNLPLSEKESVNADGDPFGGGVKYENETNFTYVKSCP